MALYIASKTKHAGHWKSLRDQGIPIRSSWIDMPVTSDEAALKELWHICVNEAMTSNALIIFREGEDVFTGGALIETGAAISHNIPVFAVGCEMLSFVHHYGVTQCNSLEEALERALALVPQPEKVRR